MLDGICFASERPTHINCDEAGHLHCEIGPALAYPTGWSWWHWHGVRVPQSIIEEPRRITVEAIKGVREPTLRRVMIERYRHGEETHGIAAYLRDADALRLDQDPVFGTLLQLAVAGEPTLVVEVVNRSPEPDGTYRHFFLNVHPELRPMLLDRSFGPPQRLTARNAVASTFGLSGRNTRPTPRGNPATPPSVHDDERPIAIPAAIARQGARLGRTESSSKSGAPLRCRPTRSFFRTGW
jgi:hypothetical protein